MTFFSTKWQCGIDLLQLFEESSRRGTRKRFRSEEVCQGTLCPIH